MTESRSDGYLTFEWPYKWERSIRLKFAGDPNPIVKLLGLDIILRNVDDPDPRTEPQWQVEWKHRFRGRVADRCDSSGDFATLLLVAPDWGRIWFHLAEGIHVVLDLENIGRALEFIVMLRTGGVDLYYPGGEPRVSLRRCDTLAGLPADALSVITEFGFEPHPRFYHWVLS